MNLFGLPLSGADAVKLNIDHEPGSASLSVDGFPDVLVTHGMIPDNPLEPNRFTVYPCFTGSLAAAQITVLCSPHQGVRKTFGFVFPVTSFRNEAQLDEEFHLIYGDAAFRGFVNLQMLSEFQVEQDWENLSNESAFLDEIVLENLSILAVSNEILEELAINSELLDLMLRKECISICTTKSSLSQAPEDLALPLSMNLFKPTVEDPESIRTLSLLLKNADRDNSEIGKFIQFYQFFEYMLKQVFEWGIPEAAIEGLSAWDVKERLSKLGGEKHRMSLINTICITRINDRTSQEDMHRACVSFLGLIGVRFDENKPWYNLLYRVRNSIVHDQFSMLTHECLTELSQLNRALRAVSLDTLFHFEKPVGPLFAE